MKKVKNVNQKKDLQIVHSNGRKLRVEEKELKKQIVLRAFANKPKTMKMVQLETGIERTSFTSLLNCMYTIGAIYKPYFGKCPISKRNGVGFYTTNEDFKPMSNQLNLFTDAA